ncbi:MAG: hypothetical protein QXR55_05800, partial [Sulfolobales archaeon]
SPINLRNSLTNSSIRLTASTFISPKRVDRFEVIIRYLSPRLLGRGMRDIEHTFLEVLWEGCRTTLGMVLSYIKWFRAKCG